MKKIVIILIRGYQITFGNMSIRVCRFEPTCSNYAIEAINRFGIFKGSMLSIWRIFRCNPFSHGGWDPVPVPAKKEEE